MIQKTHSPLAGHTRVIFELPASLWADRICVVGDFNQGQTHRTALHQERDGRWRAALDLPIGHQYRFYYVVDGERRTEYQAGSGLLSEREGPISPLDLA
jgi:1,4-alpha-glucan branching enzyme